MTPELITAFTALAAVVVSPIVSIYVVRREVNSRVISENRQAWINQLRSQVARLLTESALTPPALGDLGATALTSHERTKAIHQLANEITLYINPGEIDHARLAVMVQELASASAHQADSKTHRDEIVSVSQQILKREWVRVKEGK